MDNAQRRPWFCVGASLCLAVLLAAWYFSTPFRMIAKARNTAVRHEPELLAEAHTMLAETVAAGKEGRAWGIPGEPPMPNTVAQLGGFRAETSPRHPGAVKVRVTGGHTHFGLYIIPGATTIPLTMRRQDKSLKADHRPHPGV